MIAMTAREMVEKILDLEAQVSELKSRVIELNANITDMTNGHGIAFGTLEAKYNSLIRKLKTQGEVE